MTWEQVCDLWITGRTATVQAAYEDGTIRLRPTPDGSFEYELRNHRTQQDRDWRARDHWYNAAAANGDFEGMRYTVVT